MDISLFWLLASIVLIILGPFICYLSRNHQLILKAIDVFMVLSIGYIVLFEILPEAFEVLGWISIGILFVGLLFPLILEYGIEKSTRYTHFAIIILIIIGMGIHSFFDGTGLRVFSSNGDHAVPLLIILHRFPIGLFIWRIFHKHHKYAIYSIAYLIITAIIGYIIGMVFTLGSYVTFLAYLEAFIGGSVLHIIVHKMHCHHGL